MLTRPDDDASYPLAPVAEVPMDILVSFENGSYINEHPHWSRDKDTMTCYHNCQRLHMGGNEVNFWELTNE